MAEGDTVRAGTTDEPPAEGAGRTVHATVSRQIAPTLEQRELGMFLRSLREERGLSVEEVAERLLCPPSRIKQLEAAANLPTGTDLRDLRALFKLDDATADQLTQLAREAGKQGWWAGYQDLGVPYIGLEQHASSITSYTMQYFPALLQTGEYARAIIAAIAPQMEPKILEGRVEARLRRQHVLDSSNIMRYTVLLDEAVLRRPVGGRKVMYEQLDKVLTMIRAQKVELRIVPFERGAGVAQDSNFVLLQFNEPGPLPVVYIEGLAADHLLEDKPDVNRYVEEIERLNRSALSSGDSVERIMQAQDTYRDD
jgi:transcriptional regulator with XRE-family HTH domain